MTLKRVNDIGGEDHGPVERSERELQYWERHVDAIRTALGDDYVMLDEMRRGMEDLGPELYQRLAFFERRLDSIINILDAKGVLTRAEVEARARAIMADGTRP